MSRALPKLVRVLLVEDSADDAELVVLELQRAGFEVHSLRVDTADGMQRALEQPWDLLISDYNLPHFSGPAALALLQAHAQDVPFIIVSGSIGEDVAVAAMQAGADDYLLKGRLTRFVPAVERALQRKRLRDEKHLMEERLRQFELERARQVSELRMARAIQECLLPRANPAFAGFDLAGRAHPAEATGGDYYDFIPMPGDSLAVVLADVSGHGFGSALVMAATQAYLRALAVSHARPPDILALANRLIRANVEEDHFVTLIFARFDRGARSLVCVNAGHPAAYVLDPCGEVKARLESTAVPLGVLDNVEYGCTQTVALEEGDLVMFVTDGLVEARSHEGELFGAARVLEIVHHYRRLPAAQIVANLYEAVRAFCQLAPQEDDMTSVIVKVVAEPAS